MYTIKPLIINKNIDNTTAEEQVGYALFKYDVKIGELLCSEDNALLIIKMLNTHPLADEEI